jgi:hypothetical protein
LSLNETVRLARCGEGFDDRERFALLADRLMSLFASPEFSFIVDYKLGIIG